MATAFVSVAMHQRNGGVCFCCMHRCDGCVVLCCAFALCGGTLVGSQVVCGNEERKELGRKAYEPESGDSEYCRQCKDHDEQDDESAG